MSKASGVNFWDNLTTNLSKLSTDEELLEDTICERQIDMAIEKGFTKMCSTCKRECIVGSKCCGFYVGV